MLSKNNVSWNSEGYLRPSQTSIKGRCTKINVSKSLSIFAKRVLNTPQELLFLFCRNGESEILANQLYFSGQYSGAWSQLSQTSKMESFATIVNNVELLLNAAKLSI